MDKKLSISLTIYLLSVIIGGVLILTQNHLLAVPFIAIGVIGIIFLIVVGRQHHIQKDFADITLLKLIILSITLLVISIIRGKQVDLVEMTYSVFLIILVYIYFKIIVPKYLLKNKK